MTELTVLWEGLVSGAHYGLLGLAYLIILQATRTYNFSVGAFAGFAAVAFAVWSGTFSLPVALAFALVATVGLSIATDVLVTRPIAAREIGGHLGVVLGLTAALFVITQITRQLFSPRIFMGMPLLQGSVTLFDTTVSAHSVASILLSLAACAGVEAWQTYGRRGRLLAAVGDNWEAAVLLGLPVGGIRILAVGLGGAVCALAGALQAGAGPVSFHSGFGLALVGFLALVVGGTRSSFGPFVGGTIIGLTETLGARLIGASIREYLLLLVILVVFRLRPQGILAKEVRE
jgi:branched-chain amino acid transport system permease protein